MGAVGTIPSMTDGDGTRPALAADGAALGPRRAVTGLGDVEPDEWTYEGELERLDGVSAGLHRPRGWTRIVAVLVAVAMLLPLLVFVLESVLR